MKRSCLLIVGFLLFGCSRTEVTGEYVTTHFPEMPYHKILVCTLSGNPSRAALMNSITSKELKKYGVVADRYSDLISSAPDKTADQIVEAIQNQGYDAVLAVQRKPVPAYATLQDFFTAYLKGIPPVPKNSAPLDGVAFIIAVHQNTRAWSVDGLLYGDPNAPLAGIFQQFAERIADRLEAQGIIPAR